MKKQHFLASMVCVLALAGCARTAPVMNTTTPIAGNYTADQVKIAILQAGLQRKWVMTPVAPGVINGRIDDRGHSADIRVNYTPSNYTINYVNSYNLKADDGKIHKTYNRWVNNLDREIQLKLASQQIK
ncbi:hypothetical protein LF934_03540 [Dickeya dadantii]|uniref:hypothetical protein n=1 Tax=Dickeya dadantii TaxID=204038 RepID=UPI001C0BB1D8|nr:hypothetical protein [Dickeya dadantii]MCA7011707.1 hypothetical protein [Dickeya dadantii]QWT42739.1 hypothetical protein KNV89_09850 [Dickeya dadantii]